MAFEDDDSDIYDYYLEDLLDVSEFGNKSYYEELRKAEKEEKALARAAEMKKMEDRQNRIKREKEEYPSDDDETRIRQNKALAKKIRTQVNTAQYRNENIEYMYRYNQTHTTLKREEEIESPKKKTDTALKIDSAQARLEAIDILYPISPETSTKEPPKIDSVTASRLEAIPETNKLVSKNTAEEKPKKNRKEKNAFLNALKNREKYTENESISLVELGTCLPNSTDQTLEKRDHQEVTGSQTSGSSSTNSMVSLCSKPKKKTSQRRRLLLQDLPSSAPAPKPYVPQKLDVKVPTLTSKDFPPL